VGGLTSYPVPHRITLSQNVVVFVLESPKTKISIDYIRIGYVKSNPHEKNFNKKDTPMANPIYENELVECLEILLKNDNLITARKILDQSKDTFSRYQEFNMKLQKLETKHE
jgi:hypothetical protein